MFLGMDLPAKIAECQTIAELSTLERLYLLNEYEQSLVFERKVEIMCRVAEWGMENEQLGLVTNISDTWTRNNAKGFCSIGKMTNLYFKSMKDYTKR